MYSSKSNIITFAVVLAAAVISLSYRIFWIEPELTKIKDNLKKLSSSSQEEVVRLISLSEREDMLNLFFFATTISGIIIIAKKNQSLLEIQSTNTCEIQSLEKIREERIKAIAAISHDVKSYCSPIVTIAELIQKFGNSQPSKINEWLGQIMESTYRVRDLANDLEVTSQIGTNQYQKEFKECRLDKIVESVVDRWNNTALTHKITLEIKGGVRLIKLDWHLCDRAIHNLIGNAVKYSPGGKNIYILTDMDRSSVLVADQGIGIPEGMDGTLFDAFSRSDNVGSIPGLGLGLFIVKGCATAHSGNVAIERNIIINETGFATAIELILERGTNDPVPPKG